MKSREPGGDRQIEGCVLCEPDVEEAVVLAVVVVGEEEEVVAVVVASVVVVEVVVVLVDAVVVVVVVVVDAVVVVVVVVAAAVVVAVLTTLQLSDTTPAPENDPPALDNPRQLYAVVFVTRYTLVHPMVSAHALRQRHRKTD